MFMFVHLRTEFREIVSRDKKKARYRSVLRFRCLPWKCRYHEITLNYQCLKIDPAFSINLRTPSKIFNGYQDIYVDVLQQPSRGFLVKFIFPCIGDF